MDLNNKQIRYVHIIMYNYDRHITYQTATSYSVQSINFPCNDCFTNIMIFVCHSFLYSHACFTNLLLHEYQHIILYGTVFRKIEASNVI